MLSELSDVGKLIGPVEVWLAAGVTGELDSAPIFPILYAVKLDPARKG
jgi:hypothetical protein